MERVEPYPTRAERQRREREVAVVARPGDAALESSVRGEIERGLRDRLERLAREAGADVRRDPGSGADETAAEDGASGPDPSRVDPEASPEASPPPDLVLSTRVVRGRHTASWKRPARRPWESEAEVARRPGTCTHAVTLALEVGLHEWDGTLAATEAIVSARPPSRRWRLEHGSEQSYKDVDPACSLSSAALVAQLESTLDEALRCLERPLSPLLAPRGFVTAHRRAPDADRHLYRITLGSDHGLAPGDAIEIRRVERGSRADDASGPDERLLVVGEVTDLLKPGLAWIALDPERALAPIRAGDVARRARREGLLSSLVGPSCEEILTESNAGPDA
ncbi:MAG: hypothetical protein H6748_01405 [Spirochaetaceae bacterium]|nr:hypothetical protein [Spirochaetaceae bacterium]